MTLAPPAAQPSPELLDHTTPGTNQPSFKLLDRMTAASGTVAMSGIDALLRVLVDQRQADADRQLNTAALLCGYRGSPLGNVDSQYARYGTSLAARDIIFRNGVNEELAATMIWGSQLASTMSGSLYDGVLGMWYGKAPGVDRAGDAFRHATLSGTAKHGGVLCVAGDDPACKSSTVPSASEAMLAQIPMPVLYPGSVQEVLDYGRWGYEMSRASGLWTGLKIVTDVADAYATVEVGSDRVQPAAGSEPTTPDGRFWQPQQSQQLLAPWVLELERDIHENRLAAALAFVKRNQLTLQRGTKSAWLGIVAAGKSYYDLCEALNRLGITDSYLAQLGIRIMKPAMIWPLEPTAVQIFARGLMEILVVEEKAPFLEPQLRDILYDLDDRPVISGKTDQQGQALFPYHGDFGADQVASVLADLLAARLGAKALEIFPHRERDAIRLSSPAAGSGEAPTSATKTPATNPGNGSLPTRTPYYCSGCPHNRSNITPEGSITLGGIGCHSMSLLMPSRQVEGLTQMGGEGGTWTGAAPFVSDEHRFQNIGDGTLFHSGSLAIRQAVAAGVNITYKILFNDAVAMTGGQSPAGAHSVPELTQLLAAEGVKHTVVLSDDLAKYPADTVWAANVSLRPRQDIAETQRMLRQVKGTTALIYDQTCAAELRKRRRRRQIEAPDFRVVINERVCEGCGDCTRVSNCLSVFPVKTDFGEKTRIHQESCNQDFSCLEGDCPSFVKVTVAKRPGRHAAQPNHIVAPGDTNASDHTAAPDHAAVPGDTAGAQPNSNSAGRGDHDLLAMSQANPKAQQILAEVTAESWPEPANPPAEAEILLAGIGGTGVVTVSQILATAALLDGKYSLGLDQTGLSQKGGQVISNLKINSAPQTASNRIGTHQADVLLLFDQLAAADDAVLARADRQRTVAAVSTSVLPTGQMIADPQVGFPKPEQLRQRIEASTKSAGNCWLDADQLAHLLFKSQPPANVIMVGAAYQSGCLPVSADSIEAAIAVNGVAVEVNLAAFKLGRALIADPELHHKLLELAVHNPSPKPSKPSQASIRIEAAIDSIIREIGDLAADAIDADPGTDETTALAPELATLKQVLQRNAQDLLAYQNAKYALLYLSVIQDIAHNEHDAVGAETALTLTAARNLYKLMAYKDEYEVARLHLLPESAANIKHEFSTRAKRAYLLQPPWLTKLGLKSKIAVPHWLAAPSFVALRSLRKTRGTLWDVFGYTRERRMERQLILDYVSVLQELLELLTPDNHRKIVEIAELPDMIRGYGHVKSATVEQYIVRLTDKLTSLLQIQDKLEPEDQLVSTQHDSTA